MNARGVAAWQWQTYGANHCNRTNLLIHIATVPLFLAGNVGVIAAFLLPSAVIGVVGLGASLLAMALQGRGHALEAVPPKPFTGAANAVARILVEQWVTFPRFVLSGRWYRAWREAASADTAGAAG